ncbi:hypothetical protein KS4_25960 [Poriferisphaera corsica]|uniref:Uncharacterized protein n=1 Tax=Poriferisphaera corsica TaxID=2528020 RepID=A0A517YWD5_9BACT|nr:DUF5343 domain-containing protein [Poriferisphaera corsica]QDU34526.1 hypothetical protein KS4_25960 [Poriferisphaera corsica]
MSTKLPYLATPGSITNALDKIANAATPPICNNDFVKSKLKIKGGTGSSIAPFLKKIGLVASDGTPTKLYKQFRNPASAGSAIADAIKIGYKPLYEANEYAHELSDKELKGLIMEVTGLEGSNASMQRIYGTFKKLNEKADFENPVSDYTEPSTSDETQRVTHNNHSELPLNIGYTINLNLPPTTNIEVFNAIFSSLKQHLLKD